IGLSARPWLCASTRPGISSCLPSPTARARGCLRRSVRQSPTAAMRVPETRTAASVRTPAPPSPASVMTYWPRTSSSTPLLQRGELLDDRQRHAGVLVGQTRRHRRLLVALRDVREADRHVQLLGDGVERLEVLVHEEHLEARREVARHDGGENAIERLATAALRHDLLIVNHRITASIE